MLGLFCKTTLTRSDGHANNADVAPPTHPDRNAFRALISPLSRLASAHDLPEKAMAHTGVAKAIGVAIPKKV